MISTYRIPNFMRAALLAYANSIMDSRPPDFVLNGYMDRWYVSPRDKGPNINIHRFRGSDQDRALHDHPYDSVSILLSGSYTEHFHAEPLSVGPDGKYITFGVRRIEGDVANRPADTAHRISVSEPCLTMFITGPRRREWGFEDPKLGWVHWEAYERAYPSVRDMVR